MKKFTYGIFVALLAMILSNPISGQCISGSVGTNPNLMSNGNNSYSIACDGGNVPINSTTFNSGAIAPSAVQWTNGSVGNFTFMPDCSSLGCQSFSPCIPAGTNIPQQCLSFSTLGVPSSQSGNNISIQFTISDICYVPGMAYGGALDINLSGSGNVSLSVVQPDGVTQGPLSFDISLINDLSPLPLSLLGLDVDPNGLWSINISGGGLTGYNINTGASQICLDGLSTQGVICGDPIEICVFGGCPSFTSIQASETEICSGGSFDLSATLDPDGAPNVTYLWSGNGINASNQNSPNPSLTLFNSSCNTITETYSLTVTCTNDGSTVVNNAQVNVDVYPEVDANAVVIDNTSNVNDPNCSISVTPPCGFSVTGNTNFSPGDNGTTQTYTISNGNPDCDVNVTSVVNCIGNCSPPDVSVNVSACDASDQFTVDVTVNSMGNSTSADIVLSDGSTMNVTAPGGPFSFGPYPSTSSINVKVLDSIDPACSINLGEYSQACSDCPNLISINGLQDACNGDVLNLVTNVDQGIEGIDYAVQWYENGIAIPNGNTANIAHTVLATTRCQASVLNYTVELTCLNGGVNMATTTLTAGPINVYPIPIEGLDFVFENCSVTPIDNCGGTLTINTMGAIDPVPGGSTSVSWVVGVGTAPAACSASGTSTVTCPDCNDYPGDGQATENVLCWGESFDFSNTSPSVSALGFEVGYVITPNPPSSYGSTNAMINASIGGAYGPFPAPGSIPTQTFTNDGSLVFPTDPCGETLYFTPFLGFSCSSYTAINESGSVFTENLPGITVPGVGGITLAVPQVPFCESLANSGQLNYDIRVCVEDQTTDGEEPLAEDALFGIIDGLPGGIFSVFPNIDDKHNSGGSPTCYSQNGWTSNPSGENISIVTVNLVTLPFTSDFDRLDWDFDVDVNCNIPFPTICPDCDIIGQTVAVTFLPNTNLPNISSPTAFCEGESIDLSSLNPTPSTSAIGNFIWHEGPASNGAVVSDASAVVPPVGTTQYCVAFEYCSTGDCTEEECVNITVDPLPVLNAPTLGPICAGTAFDLSSVEAAIATGGTFNWYIGGTAANGGAAISNPAAVTPVASEQYCAEFTNAATSCSNTVCASFTYTPLPVLLSAAPMVCSNEILELTDYEASITTDPGTFAYYSTDPATGASPLTNTAINNPIDGTMYWVVFTDATSGCSATTSFMINVIPAPVLNLPAPELCAGETLDLTSLEPDVTTLAGTFVWYDDDPTNTGNIISSPATEVPISGDNYCVEFTDANTNCMDYICFVPVVNPLPILSAFTPPAFCGDSGPYDLTTFEASIAAGNFIWYDNDPTTTGVQIMTPNAVTIADGTTTTFWFEVSDATTNCSIVSSIVVEVYNPITGTVVDYDCVNDALTIDLTAVTGGSGTGYVVSAASPNMVGDVLANLSNWSVIVEDSDGCQEVLNGQVDCNPCFAIAPTTTINGADCMDGTFGGPFGLVDNGDGSTNAGEVTEYIVTTFNDTIRAVGTITDAEDYLNSLPQDSTACVQTITFVQVELDAIVADLDACVKTLLPTLSVYTLLGIPVSGNTVEGILNGIGNVAAGTNFTIGAIETLIGGSNGGPGYGGMIDLGDLLGLGPNVLICDILPICYKISAQTCVTPGACGCYAFAPTLTVNGADCMDGTFSLPFSVTDNGDGSTDPAELTEYILTNAPNDTIRLVGTLAAIEAELDTYPVGEMACVQAITHIQSEIDQIVADLDACVKTLLPTLSVYTLLGIPVTGNTLQGIIGGIDNVSPGTNFTIADVEVLIGGANGGPGFGGMVDLGDLLGLGPNVLICDVLPFCYNISEQTCITIGDCGTILGCTDPCALNYNPAATNDDGSCMLPPPCNIDPCVGDIETTDPNDACACIVVAPQVLGCTDMTACNYNANANCDDASCIPAPVCNTDPCVGDVEGVDPNDACACIVVAPQVIGCTIPASCNYNPAANCDDSSCIPNTDPGTCNTNCLLGDLETWNSVSCNCEVTSASVVGCTDPTACNFNATANCDDSSCIPNTDPGTCNTNCLMGNLETWNPSTCNCDVTTTVIVGCTDMAACNFDANANCDDNSCIIQTTCNTNSCTGGGTYVWDTNTCSCVLDIPTVNGCTDNTACNFNPNANCLDTSCIYETACDGNPCSNGGIFVWDSNTCDCQLDTPTSLGCIDINACNFNATANCDDGSCIYETACDGNPCSNGGVYTWNTTTCSCALTGPTVNGCLDMAACNYDPNANCDNGSCLYIVDCAGICGGSNTVGCLDPDACNYTPTANCNDASLCTFAPCNLGCTDLCSSNYDPTADGDDGSCLPYNSTCNSDCTIGDIEQWDPVNCECMVVQVSLLGCNNSSACNYNPAATCDDGSCEYTSCQPGAASSTIYFDADNDGMLTAADVLVSGAMITATEAGMDGIFGTADDISTNTTSGANGTFLINNLNPGNYQITVLVPTPYTFSNGTNSNTYATTVTPGTTSAIGANGLIPVNGPGQGCDLDIQMIPGWNIISSYCYPVNDTMPNVFSAIEDTIIQVKDLVDVYVPALMYNTMDPWDISQGYMVKTSDAVVLKINGTTEVDPTVDQINLNSGWNIIAYWLKGGDADPADVFDGYSPDVIQVKNLYGAYTPAFAFNGMGYMTITQGYQVKMSAPSTMMYDPADGIYLRPVDEQIEILRPEHFHRSEIVHPNNTTVIVMEPAFGTLNFGDELGIFNSDGLLVGACVYQGGNLGMLVYGEEEENSGNGMLEGERFYAKVWDKLEQSEKDIDLDILQGPEYFEKDELTVAAFKTNTGIESLDLFKINAMPNPASNNVFFSLDLPTTANEVRIQIHTIDGKILEEIVNTGLINSGPHKFAYETNHLANGIYMYKLFIDGEFKSLDKLTISH